MSKRTEDFVRSLVGRFPDLEPRLEEHLADNFGQLLPHVFFGDLTHWVLSLLEPAAGSTRAERGARLRAILSALEMAYASGEDELEELISVSFLEHLPRPGEPHSEIRSRLGPRLSAQLRVIG